MKTHMEIALEDMYAVFGIHATLPEGETVQVVEEPFIELENLRQKAYSVQKKEGLSISTGDIWSIGGKPMEIVNFDDKDAYGLEVVIVVEGA